MTKINIFYGCERPTSPNEVVHKCPPNMDIQKLEQTQLRNEVSKSFQTSQALESWQVYIRKTGNGFKIEK